MAGLEIWSEIQILFSETGLLVKKTRVGSKDPLLVIARALLAYRSWLTSELLVALLLIARRIQAISGWPACLSHAELMALEIGFA